MQEPHNRETYHFEEPTLNIVDTRIHTLFYRALLKKKPIASIRHMKYAHVTHSGSCHVGLFYRALLQKRPISIIRHMKYAHISHSGSCHTHSYVWHDSLTREVIFRKDVTHIFADVSYECYRSLLQKSPIKESYERETFIRKWCVSHRKDVCLWCVSHLCSQTHIFAHVSYECYRSLLQKSPIKEPYKRET